jgi:hypothetical protein
MLVSHRYHFIYTKTYKTAGTSVESYFEPCCMPDGAWSLSHGRTEYVSPTGIIGHRGAVPEGCLWWNHMPAAMIRERVGEEIWKAYFKFCVVRNPYDQVISAFYFFLRNRPNPTENRPDAAYLERWVSSVDLRAHSDTYLIDGRFCLDAVVRFEHLHEDVERLCERLGVPWQPERIPHFKKGDRPDVSRIEDLYTPRAREIVGRAFAYELSHFEYSFPDRHALSPK